MHGWIGVLIFLGRRLGMDAEDDALERRKMQLLQEIAGIEVEQQRRRGLLKKVPHFSEIEDAGQKLGRFLSRSTQSRLANEVAAGEHATHSCPTCGQTCPVEFLKRTVTGIDGPFEMMEPKAYCPACRRDFFPSA
jgi:hypothetical protein